MRDLSRTLDGWLDAGGSAIGEIVIRRAGAGFELRHRDDAHRADLTEYDRTAAARELATYDDAGKFRPLKTAPNLCHGWRLVLPDIAALRHALDYFYPAMIGVAASFARGELSSVPLRTTLARQTGMYRVTQKIADAQARTMIDSFCAGCMKQRLWEIDAPNPRPPAITPGAFPLLCHEACNLLVARAREVVKRSESTAA
jgi:sirohydrochlorin cobaltochelatase